MVEIQGVDYSRTANGNWVRLAAALKAQGKHFAGRYAVNDLSPSGRGISAAEYAAFTAAGVDVFLYWESSEGWMRGGFAAGAVAAVNAQQNITRAGMPATIPIYFAADFDFSPEDQPAIDDCLRGCAKVLGIERVGIYGGYHVIKRCAQNDTATWFCQTLAWSGGNLFDGAHLYQYDTQGNFIDGTDCDLVRALQANYGQASKFVEGGEQHVPPFATPAPVTWHEGDVGEQTLDGKPALAFLLEVEVVKKQITPQVSDTDERPTGIPRKRTTKLRAIGSYRGEDRNGYLVLRDGSRIKRTDVRPLCPLPKAA